MSKSIEEQLFERIMQIPHSLRRSMTGAEAIPCGEERRPPMPPEFAEGHRPPMPPEFRGGHGPEHGPGREHRPPMSRERVLMILADHEEGIRQKQIAQEMHINPSSMSEFIDRLEEGGYLTRSVDPKDKRATLITLTDKGRSRAFELQDERQEQFSQMYKNLTEEEKIQLLDLLKKLAPQLPDEEKK